VFAALAVVPGTAYAAAQPGLSATQAHDLVQQYLSERAFRVTQSANTKAGQGLDVIPMTETLERRLDREARTLDGVRTRTANTAFHGYAKAEVAVAVDSVTGTVTEARVRATERTRLFFGQDDPKAPQFEGYRLEHEFTFVRRDGQWTLDATTVELEGGGPAPAPQAGALSVKRVADDDGPAQLEGKLPQASTVPVPAAVTNAPATVADKLSATGNVTPRYNYQAMYDYAARYWQNYNPSYARYGNDCTNFVSQIMHSGGWEDQIDSPAHAGSWYYLPLSAGISLSWTVAHDWGVFAQVISHRTAPLAYVYQMLVTDVLQVDWDHPDEQPGEQEGNIDHTMFVTGQSGTAGAASEIYLTYHSNDRWNVPFWGWLIPNTEARDVWYAHRT
jgi:putative amidase-like protein